MTPIVLPGLVTEGTRESWQVTSLPESPGAAGKYRYLLGREWHSPVGRAPRVFSIVMLNPSTADHRVDDATIRRCIHFAKQEHCDELLVRNLFAYRATDPRELERLARSTNWRVSSAIVGPRNPEMFATASSAVCGPNAIVVTVAAWGALDKHLYRVARDCMPMLHTRDHERTPYVFGLTKYGDPRHPLYLKNSTRAVPWSEASAQ
jgi:hypothetical protein